MSTETLEQPIVKAPAEPLLSKRRKKTHQRPPERRQPHHHTSAGHLLGARRDCQDAAHLSHVDCGGVRHCVF